MNVVRNVIKIDKNFMKIIQKIVKTVKKSRKLLKIPLNFHKINKKLVKKLKKNHECVENRVKIVTIFHQPIDSFGLGNFRNS